MGVKVASSCFKQLTVNVNLILELIIHTSFGERLLFAVKGCSLFQLKIHWIAILRWCLEDQKMLKSFCKLVEILKNVMLHHYWSNFDQQRRLNQMFVVFFNSFSARKCFVLFDVTFFFSFFSFSSKSVVLTKFALLLLVAKFACANLAANVSAVNLFNSVVVIYLSWLWSVTLFSISLIFMI